MPLRPVRRPSTHGFTLVELMVAIAIIGVLSAILIPTYSGAQKRGYDAAAAQCGEAIVKRQIEARIENQTYFPALWQLGTDVGEACQSQDVHVQRHSSPANNAGAGVCECFDADATTLAFQVFHRRGSGYYLYWNTAPDQIGSGNKLNRLFTW